MAAKVAEELNQSMRTVTQQRKAFNTYKQD